MREVVSCSSMKEFKQIIRNGKNKVKILMEPGNYPLDRSMCFRIRRRQDIKVYPRVPRTVFFLCKSLDHKKLGCQGSILSLFDVKKGGNILISGLVFNFEK